VAALPERGHRRAPRFLEVDQPEPARSVTASTQVLKVPMSDWLRSALEYIPSWIDYQRELFDQPGVSLALARNGEVVLEHASGSADLATGEPLTPRHRFRVASHSKTFTAAGIMLLHEQEKIRLDDRLGACVAGSLESYPRATAFACGGSHARRARRRSVRGSQTLPERGGDPRRSCRAAAARGGRDVQILESRFRAARQSHRKGCRRTLSPMDT
jgi:CubicO group peptidase (beta-lactamase class C family)